MTRPLHLAVFNFRDPAHPEAGGAELHLEEILLEAVRRGHRVTWVASGFPGGAPESEHRGMRILRRGSWWNFNWITPRVFRRDLAADPPDLVIEDINKVPCFTPWWTRSPVAVIIPHLFGATAFEEASWPVALYVLLLERLIPRVYRRSRFVVISESTRDDLVARGLPADRITVVHCGLDHAAYSPDPAGAKDALPTLLYVGRLRRYKGVEWLIRSLARVRASVPDVRLEVLGDGPYRATLERCVDALGLRGAVEFLGFTAPGEKARRMRAAWALVQPSPKEGWGLTVVEAGACGTAVVAADSPGLRDSVRRDETGLLVPYGDEERLAQALTRVLTDSAARERFARAGIEWAARFHWPECGRRSLDALLPAPPGGAG